jgi:hypothetical protein
MNTIKKEVVPRNFGYIEAGLHNFCRRLDAENEAVAALRSRYPHVPEQEARSMVRKQMEKEAAEWFASL